MQKQWPLPITKSKSGTIYTEHIKLKASVMTVTGFLGPYSSSAAPVSKKDVVQNRTRDRKNLHPLPNMVIGILEPPTQLSYIHVDFLFCPRLWLANLGEEPHTLCLHTGYLALEIDHASLL